MPNFDTVDFFSDAEVNNDPLPYFEHFRAKCPIAFEPRRGTFIVTGYDEAAELFGEKSTNFSNRACIAGPVLPLPFTPEGTDITAQIAEHGDEFPWATHFITFDPPTHTAHRRLLTQLLTRERLKRNEAFMEALADRLIDTFIDSGSCEVVGDYGQAMATLVIADLLGVPEEDRDGLVETIGRPPGMIDDPEHKSGADPLEFLDRRFARYFDERRRDPQDDMMSELLELRFRDGSKPRLDELIRIATFLFVAGQDTSAKLVASAFKVLCECSDLQERLRSDPARIPDFIEEVLRMESPTKVKFNLATRDTQVAGVPIPAGAIVTTSLSAVNRDPTHFPDPNSFDIDRPHVRDHMAFGRGAHACPGAPLARFEGRITVERFLARMANIRLSKQHHGPAEAPHFEWEPTYLLHGLERLHIEFDKL